MNVQIQARAEALAEGDRRALLLLETDSSSLLALPVLRFRSGHGTRGFSDGHADANER